MVRRFKAQRKITKGYRKEVSPTFIENGINMWNLAPAELRLADKYHEAKKISHEFVKSLPF